MSRHFNRWFYGTVITHATEEDLGIGRELHRQSDLEIHLAGVCFLHLHRSDCRRAST